MTENQSQEGVIAACRYLLRLGVQYDDEEQPVLLKTPILVPYEVMKRLCTLKQTEWRWRHFRAAWRRIKHVFSFMLWQYEAKTMRLCFVEQQLKLRKE